MDNMNIRTFQLYGKTKKDSILCRFLINNAYLCSMNMKKIIYLFAILLMLAGCNGTRVTEKLNQIDSLIAKELFDSACIIHHSLNEATMTEEDKAHYCLLATQLGYVTNHPLSSDSLLEMAYTYYKKVGNNLKLANAYYYKSLWSESNNNYSQAILYGKEAERLAMDVNDDCLQFKIAENLAYLNGLSENNLLQLQYAKIALAIAQRIQNKNWMVYSYNRISYAFANLDQYDSVFYYIEKSIPYINNVYDSDKAEVLTNIGLLLKEENPKRAKELFEKAIEYNELPITLEHLADVYYAEGNKEKAYSLWKQALTKSGGIGYVKANLIHSIISYDLEHGNIDNVSKNLDEIINIKDSILNKLKNDTIKDLQLRFDHEVAMHEADKKLINAQRLLMGGAVIMGILIFIIYYRKKKEESLEREHQMQLYAYTTEINNLEAKKENAISQIWELKKSKEEYGQKISELQEEAKNSEAAIHKLNKDIQSLLNERAPKLKQGSLLYNHIVDGGTTSGWHYNETTAFNSYYAATHYRSYSRIMKVERSTKLSAHNLFYLILKDMGKTDDEIRRIMHISPEGLRSLRSRTKPKEKE